jgi:hypothetical protein
MGNLGRMGYGGTLDGMWPYTYDSCDVGTLPNQTRNGMQKSLTQLDLLKLIQLIPHMTGLPEAATTTGPEWSPFNGTLSYLTGQRLSACTCPDDPTHPGPKRTDGTFVGRAAPEIDIIEAQVRFLTLAMDCLVSY